MVARGWRQYTITCAQCGETVNRSNPSKTCSIACRDALRRTTTIEASETVACPVCGTVAPLWKRVGDLMVCSQRCQAIVYARSRSPRNWPAWREAVQERRAVLGTSQPCLECGTSFTLQRYDRKFCSTRCQDRWSLREGLRGRNLRVKQARARDAANAAIGACALCGTTHDQIVPAADLGVHRRNAAGRFHKDHILARTQGGTDDPANVRHLCWFCNLARMDMSSTHDAAIGAAGRAFWSAITRASPP